MHPTKPNQPPHQLTDKPVKDEKISTTKSADSRPEFVVNESAQRGEDHPGTTRSNSPTPSAGTQKN
jgi:hypothetical protein